MYDPEDEILEESDGDIDDDELENLEGSIMDPEDFEDGEFEK